jgi:hypothetical protein
MGPNRARGATHQRVTLAPPGTTKARGGASRFAAFRRFRRRFQRNAARFPASFPAIVRRLARTGAVLRRGVDSHDPGLDPRRSTADPGRGARSRGVSPSIAVGSRSRDRRFTAVHRARRRLSGTPTVRRPRGAALPRYGIREKDPRTVHGGPFRRPQAPQERPRGARWGELPSRGRSSGRRTPCPGTPSPLESSPKGAPWR